MNKGFNVLAVMDEYPDLLDFAAIHYGEWVANCKGAYIASPHVIESLEKARKARDAVAELIEAMDGGRNETFGRFVFDEHEANRLRAALARVRGEE